MHGTVLRPIASNPYQRLFERACPGPMDHPHPARLYLLSFWVQNYWGRWSHARKCFADLRWNGKVHCKPDATWETTAAIGLDEALCLKLDYRLPKVFSKTPVLGFFLLWLLAMLAFGPTWEDSPPEPQHKNIETYRSGLAPFHHVHVTRPDGAEEKRLIEAARAGDVIARNTVIAGHLWLADEAAGEFYVDESERDDIRQQAAEFLFKALDDFNPKRGTRFSTFAWKSVRADLKDWLREMGRLRRHVSTELIAETNEAALGLYGSNSKKLSAEHKIFRGLFEKT